MTVQQIAGRVAPLGPSGTPSPQRSPAPGGPGFAEVLARAAAPDRASDLTVSAHAADRLAERGIDFGAIRERVSQALDVLSAKGARDALLVGDGAALVVSVPNRTVVTALAPAEMRDRAVTQIDSALLL